MSLRYDDKVAIVTGAGNGLGRTYALLLAERGAKVVVNDLGKDKKTGEYFADRVVTEIKNAGGVAIADHHSVTDGAEVVQTALDAFGTVHIIVSNAGILRDVGFKRMTKEQFDIVQQVHVHGTFAIVKAAWGHMYKQQYGRIILITSINGIRGQRGQVNYSCAKSGLIGMGFALAKEGARKNIKVNTVAPSGGTAMTATILPPEIVNAWKPEYVAPLVGYLAHESIDVTGKVYEAGGGWFGEHKWVRAPGLFLSIDKPYSVEDVQSQFGQIGDFTTGVTDSGADSETGFGPALQQIMAKL